MFKKFIEAMENSERATAGYGSAVIEFEMILTGQDVEAFMRWFNDATSSANHKPQYCLATYSAVPQDNRQTDLGTVLAVFILGWIIGDWD